MSSPEIPRDNPETFIQRELKRLQLDRAAFLLDVGIDETELKNIIKRGDVQVMFRLDLESPETANLNALESITSWVLMVYQSTWNTPTSIKELTSKPLPQGTTPEVRFAHWKLRQIAKLDSQNKTYMKVDAMWKKLQTASAQAFPPKTQWETEVWFIDRAKNFIWEHKVASSVIGIGGAALLYKLFGSSGKSEGDTDKWFFSWLMDKIPNMWFLGVIVALVWLWYFRDDIRGLFKKGQETIEVAGKLMDKAKVVEKILSSDTSLEEKKVLIKSLIEQDPNGKSLVEKIAGTLGIDISKWEYKWPKEGEPTGNLVPIGIARGTQFYYGTVKPWINLNVNEQAIFRWTVNSWFTSWFSRPDINHEQALGRIPEIESEIGKLEASIWVKTEESLAKLSAWNGSMEWRNWKEFLKHPWVLEELAWADSQFSREVGGVKKLHVPNIQFSQLNTDAQRILAQQFARQEIDILIQAEKSLIDAIRSWPAQYGKFLASRGDSSLLYGRIQELTSFREKFPINSGYSEISVQEWRRFYETTERTMELVWESNAVLEGKKARLLEIAREIEWATGDRKVSLEADYKKIALEYAEVETRITEQVNKTLMEEKAIARVLSSWPDKLHEASWNPFHWIGKKSIAKARTIPIETLDELRLISPKSPLLRMWFSKWNFVLMGVWVGAVLYANDGIMNDWAKHDLERMAWGLVPLIWGAMDMRDAWKDFWEGRVAHGFANLWAAAASYSWDALLALSLIPAGTTAPLGIGAKWALAGLRGFLKGLWVEWAQSVAIKEALPESWKLVLNVVDASGKAVEKTVELTPEWRNAWKWIQDRMAPQRERIASFAKMGLIWGIWAMLVAWPGMVLASYALDKDAWAQKLV